MWVLDYIEKIFIQLIQREDFDELYALWKQVGFHLSRTEVERKDFELILQFNPDSCFKIIHADRIIGSSLGTFNGRRGWIYHLAIHPDFQTKKLGSNLLEKTNNSLKKRGARKVIVGVDYKNLKTMPFYEKNGFVVMDDAVLMAKKV